MHSNVKCLFVNTHTKISFTDTEENNLADILDKVRGATLHQKMVVTGVGDIWRARGARAYNGGLGAEPPAGSRGRAPVGVRFCVKKFRLYVEK